jgi:GR25 family glycosyltransferase involved in LPS biosynthesis
MVRYLTRNSKHWSATNVTRLLNIELSHRNLWQAGLDSGADWILILEDDAYCADASDLAEGLTALVSETGAEKRVTFVNLSASFTPKELGVSHLLKVSADLHWKGSDLRAVFTCARPVTNTVCALLYSRDYLQSLVSVWDSLPMSPVLPIDWKMNKAIMHMQVEPINDMGEALWIEPAPILQRSMHSVER